MLPYVQHNTNILGRHCIFFFNIFKWYACLHVLHMVFFLDLIIVVNQFNLMMSWQGHPFLYLSILQIVH